MSWDTFFRIPGPWEQDRLVTAFEQAAAAFPGAHIEHHLQPGRMTVYAEWPPELISRWDTWSSSERAMMDPGSTSGELDLVDCVDEPDDWSVSTLPATVAEGGTRRGARTRELLGFAVHAGRLASHGLRGGLLCLGRAGFIGGLSPLHGLLPEPSETTCDLHAGLLRAAEGWVVGDRGTVLERHHDPRRGVVWKLLAAPCDTLLDRVGSGPDGTVFVEGAAGRWRREAAVWVEERLAGPAAPEARPGSAARSFPPEVERAGVEVSGWCRALDGSLFVGTAQGQLLRSAPEGRFSVVETGPLGRVHALALVGDMVMAAVASLPSRDGRRWGRRRAPGLVQLKPGRYIRLHIGSSSGCNRETWGVTSVLGETLARLLGGVVEET
jgi:hypothetical protein